MRCDQHCKWYPAYSYENTTYKEGKYGVKYANKKPHVCILSGKVIKKHYECSEYSKLDETTDLLDK